MDSGTNISAVTKKSSRRKRRGFRYSLGFGITVAILCSSLASALFMHTAWRLFVERSTNELSTRVNQEIFFSIRGEVNSLFRNVIRTQNTLYNVLRSEQTSLQSADDIESLYLNTIVSHPDFSWISYGRADGTFLGAHRLENGNIQWHVSSYDPLSRRATRLIEEYRIEGRELVLVDTSSLVNEYYSPERAWFQNAIKSETSTDVWTNVYVFSTNRVPGINSSVAIRNPETNEIEGVVSIAVTLGLLSDYISNLRVSQNGVLFIVTAEQELIAYRDQTEVVITNPDSALLTLRTLASSNDARLRTVNEAIVANDFSLTSVGNGEGGQFSTVFTSSETDEEYSLSLAPLANESNTDLNLADLGWYFGIVVPTVDILGAIQDSAQQLLFITYGIIAIIITLVFLFMRAKFIKPIRQIANQADHIRQLELESVKLPDSTLSEINLLTQSISRMNVGLNSFKKYVPTELVQSLIKKGLEAKLGGVEGDVTIFFSDIARFTHISKILRENLISHLDAYFTNLSEVIRNHGGTIDKYIGDAIMAFWGAPITQEDHAIRACSATLRCAQVLRRLRANWESQGEERLFVRFGLNSGKVLVGNFGSHERMSYTVIGDPVNIASRLEALNKVYGTEILIGEATYAKIARHFVTRKLDRVALYGLTESESIEVYELIAEKDNDYDPSQYRWIDTFEEGLRHYREQQWKEAVKCFFVAQEERTEADNASLLFIKRCQYLARRHVPADWDGTFVLQSK